MLGEKWSYLWGLIRGGAYTRGAYTRRAYTRSSTCVREKVGLSVGAYARRNTGMPYHYPPISCLYDGRTSFCSFHFTRFSDHVGNT